jgi:hypothetical protein
VDDVPAQEVPGNLAPQIGNLQEQIADRDDP